MITYTLSELLEAVGLILSDNLPDRYWVKAEISSLSARTGGHCYMELIESNIAKVRANCWANVWYDLSRRFTAATDRTLQPGMSILAQVSVSFHRLYGFSLTIHDIDPLFSLGDIAMKRQENIAKLEKTGMTKKQRLLSLPTLPKRIAVISSQSAAGYQDFEHQLKSNNYSFAFRTTLFEAAMQGENAAKTIIEAIKTINQEAGFDAIVIIRGGGATTDLSCFDDYDLAVACACSTTAVITGIGHTRDVSLLDMVAYRSLKTPTAVAEFFIGLMAEQLTSLVELDNRLHRTAIAFVERKRQRADSIAVRLRSAFINIIRSKSMQLAVYENNINICSPERIFKKGYTLTTLNGQLLKSRAQVKDGDIIQTEWQDGCATSVIRDK